MRISTDEIGEIENDPSRTFKRSRMFVASVLCLVMVGTGITLSGVNTPDSMETDYESTDKKMSSRSDHIGDHVSSEAKSVQPGTTARTFAVSIRQPTGPPTVATGLTDIHEEVVTVACSTCHATRQPNHNNKTAKDLDEFHGGMPFSHGNVSCLSCHNGGDYDALKLADGSRVEFTDVMTLCAQCHGPQMTAYQHGAHGGMTGHWDLKRGPREKNNCIDCHDPHAPQFPQMQPNFKPQDRFLDQPKMEH